MHIGLIGGIGPAAIERYYRGLIERTRKPLDLTIVHADVPQLATNLSALASVKQAEVFASLVRRWPVLARSLRPSCRCADIFVSTSYKRSHHCRCSTPSLKPMWRSASRA